MKKFGKYEKMPDGTRAKQPPVKNVLLQTYFTSLMCLLLCVTMFFGTTFAWFTSEVNNVGNEIYIGTLDVELHDVDGNNLAGSDKPIFDKAFRWEPGSTVIKTLNVVNKGDIPFDYSLIFTETSGVDMSAVAQFFDVWVHNSTVLGIPVVTDYAQISEANGWSYVGSLADVFDGESVFEGGMTDAEVIQDPKTQHTYTIALHMKEDTTSEQMNSFALRSMKLNVKLVATQKAANVSYDISLLPQAADFASLQSLVASASSGDVIAVTESIVMTEPLNINENITLYLAGNELSGASIVVSNNATLTLSNGSADSVMVSNTQNNSGIALADTEINYDGKLILENMNIKASDSHAIYVKDGVVQVIVRGKNKLVGAQGGCGIYVDDGAQLYINGATENDMLTAIGNGGAEDVTNGNGGHGIGGEGTISIDGIEKLIAKGYGKHGFGIGGAVRNITITNTTITHVQGGFIQPEMIKDPQYGKDEPEGGAAIGSSSNGAVINLTKVVIYNAKGGSKAAGIGARYWTGVTINITDCDIKNVEGGNASAGIGGSRISEGAGSEQNITITIMNSTVTAKGGAYGAGIGSGYDTRCQSSQPLCTINITGSTINATGGKYAAGIGTGFHHANLTGSIEGGIVNASSGEEFYKSKYTTAMDIGFGVVDPTREGQQSGSIVYNGKTLTYEDAPAGVTSAAELKVALDNGKDVVLYADIALTEGVTIAADKTVVLDLNGYTISQTVESTAGQTMISNDGNLTITGNGKLSLTDTGVVSSDSGYGSYTIRNAGNLVVENATVELVRGAEDLASNAIFNYSGNTAINGGAISASYSRSVRVWNGSVTINGGIYDGQVWAQPQNDNGCKLTINGGSFKPGTNGSDGSSVYVTNSVHYVEFSVTGGSFATKIGCADASKLAGCITGGEFTDVAKQNTAPELFAS